MVGVLSGNKSTRRGPELRQQKGHFPPLREGLLAPGEEVNPNAMSPSAHV